MKSISKMFRGFFTILFSLTIVAFASQALAQGGTWTTKTPMPSVSGGPKGAVVDDIFYVMKPCLYHIGESQAFYAYDSGTDAWTPRTPMPTPRHAFAHGVIDGIIYTAGGWDGASLFTTVEAYDPATDTWTTKTPMPTARRGMAGGVVNGILYAIGGEKPYDSPYIRNDVEAYDPATKSWTIKTPMLTPRSNPGVGVVNGIIYAVGGHMGGPDFSATVEAYDPATDTWTTKTSMPKARSHFAVEVIDGILYAIGGTTVIDGEQIWLSTVEALDPATDTWTTKTPMPTARMNVASGVVNGILYAAGGWNLVSFATLEAFTPEIMDTTPPVIIPTVTPAPNAEGWNNTDVTVSWDVSDPESGSSSSTGCDTTTLTTETTGTTLTCSATNAAGLSNSISVIVKIDKTPPSVACSASPNSLWPPNHKMVTVNASVTVSDSLSGTAGFTLTSATSNEPDEGLGDGDLPNDIQGWTIGTADTVGSLRAERSGLGTGRIYRGCPTVGDLSGGQLFFS